MEIYKGAGAFSGIAIGRILYYHRNEYRIRQYVVNNVKSELEIFGNACLSVEKNLENLCREHTESGNGGRYLKQRELLESGSFRRAVESIIQNEKVNAAYAVITTRDELSVTFRSLEDGIIRERIDLVREVSDRLVSELGGISPRINLGEDPVILVTENILPTELMEMDKEKLLALVTHQGSDISHAAILAKSMNLPAVTGIEPQYEWDGENAIVDGYTGTLYIDPEEKLLREYEARRHADLAEREELLKLRTMPDVTMDGKEVNIYANIGNLDDLSSVLYYRASGIGLLRSEFQYLGRENYPEENELFQAYKKVAETMGDNIAVIRTADLGADKHAEYLDIPKESNPIMGNRGIRLCLDRKQMFKAQLRAIYRAGVYGNLAMMYPMISSEAEVDAIEALIAEVKEELREKGIPFKNIATGIMVETPAAVMISRELARRVDFLSLGTNDLTQYTLAMDRQNPLLNGKYNDHHPAVLRMIKWVVEAGHSENCRVGICGELAADTKLTRTFLEMGVDSLSVVPACILPVRQAVRRTDLRK